MNEADLKNAWKDVKSFFRNKYSAIKRKAKDVVKYLKKNFGYTKNPGNFKPGKLISFEYKAKDASKRFDRAPLVIVLGAPKNRKIQKTHFIGLNIHWVKRPEDRVKMAKFFLALLEKRKGKLTYDDIKPWLYRFKGQPVLRMYIIKNVSNRVTEMPSDMYMTAAAVPSERWSR